MYTSVDAKVGGGMGWETEQTGWELVDFTHCILSFARPQESQLPLHLSASCTKQEMGTRRTVVSAKNATNQMPVARLWLCLVDNLRGEVRRKRRHVLRTWLSARTI